MTSHNQIPGANRCAENSNEMCVKDGVINADNDMCGAEECTASEDNDLFHVHWCVCLCWRKAPCCTHCSAVLFLTDLLTVFLFRSFAQIDLEPEGKVYVVIDLSGSSTEGKKTPCFMEKEKERGSFLKPTHTSALQIWTASLDRRKKSSFVDFETNKKNQAICVTT